MGDRGKRISTVTFDKIRILFCEEFKSPSEISRQLDLSPPTVYKYINEHKLNEVKEKNLEEQEKIRKEAKKEVLSELTKKRTKKQYEIDERLNDLMTQIIDKLEIELNTPKGKMSNEQYVRYLREIEKAIERAGRFVREIKGLDKSDIKNDLNIEVQLPKELQDLMDNNEEED